VFSKCKYVYQVYKEGNFTRAAEKLFISQPSLSAAIKGIESKIGAALFERTGNRCVLTEIGEAYITATEQILNAENEFERKMNDIYSLESGQLVVGGTNYLSSYVLPKIINRFTMRYPKIKVTLVEANSGSLGDMLKNGQVDIIIDSFEKDMDAYEGYPLVSERILLCVPEDRAVNRKLSGKQILPESIYNGSADLEGTAPVSVREFEEENFVLLKPGNDMYARAMAIFEKEGFMPNVAFYLDQLNISYALAESGIGLCFVTDTFLKYAKFKNNVLLYNVGENHCNRTLYVAHKKNKYCTRAMQAFIQMAKDIVK